MKPSAPRGLLAALAKVALVEREAEVSVLQHEVLTGGVVAASVHGRRHLMAESCPGAAPERDVAERRCGGSCVAVQRVIPGGLRRVNSVADSGSDCVMHDRHDHDPDRRGRRASRERSSLTTSRPTATSCSRPAPPTMRADCSSHEFADLAIVDLGLPDGDGLELIRACPRGRSGVARVRPDAAADRPLRPRRASSTGCAGSSAAATTT